MACSSVSAHVVDRFLDERFAVLKGVITVVPTMITLSAAAGDFLVALALEALETWRALRVGIAVADARSLVQRHCGSDSVVARGSQVSDGRGCAIIYA